MKILRLAVLLGIWIVTSICQAQTLSWQDMGGVGTGGTSLGSGGSPSFQPEFSSSQSGSAYAEAVTPDIQALARGLQNDPTRIFNYVHDHIRHVFYYVSKKGAELTLLEQSGNDFDQCSLLVALLQAAGYTNAVYQYGVIQAPYAATNQIDVQHWLGLTLPNTNWFYTSNLFNAFSYQRGYPFWLYNGDGNSLYFQHVWVLLNLGGTNFYLDPAVKFTEPISGLTNLAAAMGLNTNTLATAAGGTDTGGYKYQSLSQSGLQGALQNCNSNLLEFIASNAPNASVEQIISGEQIISSVGLPLRTNLIFPAYTNDPGDFPILQWSTIPTSFMSSIEIGIGTSNFSLFTPQLQGKRLSLTFDSNGVAQIWLDDTLQFQTSSTGTGSNVSVTLSAFHPYGQWLGPPNNFPTDTGGAFNSSIAENYQRTNANYAISYAFEASPNWLQQREKQLDAYRAEGFADSSRQVATETLNVMGLNWMVQTELSGELLSKQLNILPQYHHRLGRMAQETGNGYYIDIYNELVDGFPATGYLAADIANKNQAFEVGNYFASAAEHGMIEQLGTNGTVAASTVKILDVANATNEPIFLATSTNWTSGANIQGSLSNYSSNTLSQLNSAISSGYWLLLPQSGAVPVGNWAGTGYVLLSTNTANVSAGLVISGGYAGGYSGQPNSVPPPGLISFINSLQPTFIVPSPVSAPPSTTAEPVNMSDCTFQIDGADLELGDSEPRGLHFGHHYASSLRNYNLAGMADGWVHNYYVTANPTSSPEAGTGTTTPAQMAPMLVATYAAANFYNAAQPDPKNWMITAMIAEWGVNQLLNNAVSVSLGKDTVQFIKQPDGSYTPPANSTLTLTGSSGAYTLQERHGNQLKFGPNNCISNIVDQYGQSLSVAYNSSNWVQTVTDWKSRQFTFTYSGTPLHLTQVSDSTGRSVSFGYGTDANGQLNLTSITDPESKTSSFVYDTNHQVIATFDANSQLVVTNQYDSFGRVMTQFTGGNTNETWQMYWNGFANMAVDPMGGQQEFFFDEKVRQTGTMDALGNTSQTIYDGQDHVVQIVSPLNETNQFIYDGNNNLIETIDPLNFSNVFTFDLNNNLVAFTDQRTNTSHFGYNAEFSLTALTNGAGDVVSYAYNTDGTLHTRTDSGGTTTYGYDSYGQLNSATYPNSLGTNQFVNNALGDVITNINPRGFPTGYQYNHRRQMTGATAPTNLTTSVAYDAVGNVASITDARSQTTSNLWSVTRQPLATIMPSTPQGVPVVSNSYDSRDWLATVVNPLIQTTRYSNDLAGRGVAIVDALLRTNTIGYDDDGRPTSATNAAQEAGFLQWNQRGDLLQVTDPATNIVKNAFDAAGNQILLTNRNGKVWQFQFDAANRLTNAISPLNRQTRQAFNHQGLVQSFTDPMSQTTTFGYDALGRLTSRADLVATTSFVLDSDDNLATNAENGQSLVRTFDAYDRVSSYTDAGGNVIQYRYDANGNLTSLIYPGGRTVTYVYDNLNRLTSVTDWASRQTTFSYDLAGRLTTISRPNGTVCSNYYDAAGELTNIIEQAASRAPIAYFKMSYSTAARVQWEFAGPVPQPYTPPSRTDTFDNDNRLLTVNGTSVTNDLDGNLTYGPLPSGTFATYSYDARNRLTTAGGLNYGYDPGWNRVVITNGTNVTQFVVNPQANLPQVLMRIKSGGITNYYVYGGGLLYEVDETAATTNTAYYHFDARGSTVALTDSNGNVTDHVEYSAYGSATYRLGTNDTPFLFNGRFGVQTDTNGLLYMQARYYNPYLCRFLSADPSGFAGGLNLYAFADGNPVSMWDPTGLGSVGDLNAVRSWLNGASTVPANPSDPFGLLRPSHQNMVPTIMCHGVSAGGYNGDPNSFAGIETIPGSGPNAMLGYAIEGHMAAMGMDSPKGAMINAPIVAVSLVFPQLLAARIAVVADATTVATSTILAENDVVIGFVQNGRIIASADTGASYATAISHEALAQQAGVWAGRGALSEGTEAFTVVKQAGQIIIRGSNNFNPTVSKATEALLQSAFK